MSPAAIAAVAIVEALLKLAAEAPTIISEIQQSANASADVKALLDGLDKRIAEHEQKLDAMDPLPVPDPPPTAPTR